MALFGDTALLLTHIRRSFIMGDDSGICEKMVTNEQITASKIQEILSEKGPIAPAIDSENTEFYGESPEIFVKVNRSFRPSRVEDRLTEFRQEKASVSRTVNISLRDMPLKSLPEEELRDLLSPEEIPPQQPQQRSRKSGVSLMNGSPPPTPLPKQKPNLLSTQASSSSSNNSTTTTTTLPQGSLLSKLLQEADKPSSSTGAFNSISSSLQPFNEYSRFDGHYLLPNATTTSASPPPPVRVYLCYLSLDKDLSKVKPLLLRPIRGIKVHELLGLAHFQYVKENRQPIIQTQSLQHLELFPYDEDTRELECDFSSLELKDELSKYQFEAFAVVERSSTGGGGAAGSRASVPPSLSPPVVSSTPTAASQSEVFITIHLPQGHSKIGFTLESTLQDVLERVIRRRGLRQLTGYDYRLEPPDDVDTKLDMTIRLADTTMRTFTLRREHSRRDPINADGYYSGNELLVDEINTSMTTSAGGGGGGSGTNANTSLTNTINSQENLSQRQYRVQLKKGIINRDVYLTVSQQQIEVMPVASRAPWPRKKRSHTYNIDLIAHCEFDEPGERASGRKVCFKIVYLPMDSASAEALLGATGAGTTNSGGTTNNPRQSSPAVMATSSPPKSSPRASSKSNTIMRTVGGILPLSWLDELQTLVFEAQWSTSRSIKTKLNAILDHVACPLRLMYRQHLFDTIGPSV